jgi:hypothetical protein
MGDKPHVYARLSQAFVRYYVDDIPTDNDLGAVSGGSPGAGPIRTVVYVPVSDELLADVLPFSEELAHHMLGHVPHYRATDEALADPAALGRLLHDAWAEVARLTVEADEAKDLYLQARRAARRALGLYVAEAEDIDPDDDVATVLNTEQWGG